MLILYAGVRHWPQGQRTVYRLTIVKEWNDSEMQGYVDLISLGTPDFIEIKVCGLANLTVDA